MRIYYLLPSSTNPCDLHFHFLAKASRPPDQTREKEITATEGYLVDVSDDPSKDPVKLEGTYSVDRVVPSQKSIVDVTVVKTRKAKLWTDRSNITLRLACQKSIPTLYGRTICNAVEKLFSSNDDANRINRDTE